MIHNVFTALIPTMSANRNLGQKGAYLLPNLLTTAALFAGFYSIISGINGHYAAAAIAVVVAGILDGLDGRVARLTNTQSEFGVQYDSLSDLVSFGLAPSLLAFNWSLSSLSELSALSGKLGWAAAFVYAACAALRLARFNSQAATEEKSHFQGLASPAAAGTLVVTIWFFVDNGVAGASVVWLIWFMTVGLGVLMFSRVRYYSFKTLPLASKVPIAWIFLLVLALVLLSIDPPAVLMGVAVIYITSGLVVTLMGRRERQVRRRRLRQLRDHRKQGGVSADDSSQKEDD